MALPTWPASLPPVPLLDGTGIAQLSPDLDRTEMDDGPARVRRRTLTVTTKMTHKYRMSPAQFETFRLFHLNDLNAGAMRFTMPVWTAGKNAPLPMRTVRLYAVPAVDMRANYYLVTLSIDVYDDGTSFGTP